MEFAIRGVSFGEEVELVWRDGEVTGHPQRVELLKAKARTLRRVPVGATKAGRALSLGPDHLANPHGAYHLMKWGIFQEVLEERGDVPKPPVPRPGSRY